MIEYTVIGGFKVEDKQKLSDWILFTLDEEGRELGEINYIFCDDDYLHDINVKNTEAQYINRYNQF